jgi:antitoxin component YwqK of YwqJK toxin-antitoxin module
MNTRIIFFCFIILFCSTIASAQVDKGNNITDAKGFKQGFWKKTDDLGVLKYEGTFKDNKPMGSFIYYFQDGAIKAKSNYSQNGNLSRTTLFYETGTIKAVGNYLNEKKDSVWNFYDEKGRLTANENYADNVRKGLSITYYPSGKIFEESTWENNLKSGLSTQYFENGKKKEQGNIVDGHYEGQVVRYHSSGEKAAVGNYVHGAQAGSWFYYDENGIPTFSEIISRGEPTNLKYYNGTFDEKYANNIPKSQFTYKNGLKNGPFIEYYDKGKFKQVLKKGTDGFPDETEEVLEGTQIKVQGTYLKDMYDGLILFYSQDGKLEKKEKYLNGKLVK